MLYTTPFTILKSLHLIGHPTCLKKMTLVQENGYPLQRSRASEGHTGFSSHRSNHEDYKDPLNPNKLDEPSIKPF